MINAKSGHLAANRRWQPSGRWDRPHSHWPADFPAIQDQLRFSSVIETTQTRHPDSLTPITSHASARPIRWPWASPTYICPGRGARGYAEVSEKVTYAFCDFM